MKHILLFLSALAVAMQLAAQSTELDRIRGMKRFIPAEMTEEQKKEYEKGEAELVAELRKYVAKNPLDIAGIAELAPYVPVEEAQKLLAVYAAARPDDPDLYRARALVFHRAGQTERMFADFQKMADLEPRNADSHYTVGVAYYEVAAKEAPAEKEKREYIRRGVAALDKALELRPEFFEAMTYKQLLLRQQALLEKDPAEAQLRIAEADVIRAAVLAELQKKKGEIAERERPIYSDADLAAATIWRVAIMQDGQYVGSDATATVHLDRRPFTIRVFLPLTAPVMLNALDSRKVFERVVPGFRIPAQCKPIVAFCGGTGMAEGPRNEAKQLFLDPEGMHYLTYESESDHRWSRVKLRAEGGGIFDRDVARIGDTPIEKTDVAKLYLLFGVALNDDDQLSDRELRRVRIEFR